MAKSKQEVIEQIQKLMGVANAKKVANINEAEQALRIAQKMMVEYNVQEVELHVGCIADLEGQIIGKMLFEQDRRVAEDVWVPGTITEFFNVRLIWKGSGNLYCVGTQENIEMAHYVYMYLRNIYKTLWHRYHYGKPPYMRDRSQKKSYYYGLTEGIREKLQVQKDSIMQDERVGTALMVTERILVSAYNRMFPKRGRGTNSGYVRHEGAIARGKADARHVNINSGLTGNGNGGGQLQLE